MVPIVRSLVSIPAGIAKMNLGQFALYTAVGTGLWSFLLAFAGYLLGQNWALAMEWLSRYEKVVLVLVGVAVIVVGAKRLAQLRQKSGA